jgi:hypothetical protein
MGRMECETAGTGFFTGTFPAQLPGSISPSAGPCVGPEGSVGIIVGVRHHPDRVLVALAATVDAAPVLGPAPDLAGIPVNRGTGGIPAGRFTRLHRGGGAQHQKGKHQDFHSWFWGPHHAGPIPIPSPAQRF